MPPEGGRVCIVLLTGVGDVVHGLPLVNVLRETRPDLTIWWVAEPAPAQILEHHPAVDRIVVYRKNDGFGGIMRLARELRAEGRFDLTINAQRYFKSIFPTLLSGAPIRLGLGRDRTRDGVSLFNTHHQPPGPWKHTQDIFLDFLPLLGLPKPADPRWNIAFSAEEDREAAAYFSETGSGPRVGLAMGTANPRKDWPTENYVALADRLTDRFGMRVFLLGGPGERERTAARRVMEEARMQPIWAMAESVRTLMWRIRGMDLVISPDTAAVHISRALGVPVIGLYGHTNPWRVGPYRGFEQLVIDRYTDTGELPDPSRYDPRHGRMERITVEDVLERVELARRLGMTDATGAAGRSREAAGGDHADTAGSSG